MLLMSDLAKCTRRHAGGNNSISVRMAALKPLGSEIFSRPMSYKQEWNRVIYASVVKSDCGGFCLYKGVIYCLNS